MAMDPLDRSDRTIWTWLGFAAGAVIFAKVAAVLLAFGGDAPLFTLS